MKSNSRYGAWLALGTYAAALPLAWRLLGPGAETFAVLAVLTAAALDGLATGLWVAAGCLVWHVVAGVAWLNVAPSAWFQGGALATSLAVPLVGAVVGRLRDLRVELNRVNRAHQKTELDLRDARSVAEQASQAKSEFLARMSHEIRTPMHGVLGMTQVLAESSLTPDQREHVGMIEDSGKLLLGVINDILDFSRIEAGHLELDPVDFALEPTLRDTVDLLSVTARQKGLQMTADLPQDLPRFVVGDALRLRQILVNLLGNAVKFTEHGWVRLSAGVTPLADGKVLLRLEVADTGVGMPPDVMQRMFEPFGQADASTTRVYGGTGLGLTISRQLVELMGGKIGCTSEPGRGSTFWVEVPLSIQVEPVVAAPAVPAWRPTVAGTRILMAEDNHINQVIASRLLESLGVSVDVVADGEAAVHAALTGAYDVVLLDCQMPVCDGLTAARRIRASEPSGVHLPILAVTASAQPGEHDRCRAAGMDAMLLKPLQADELRETVLRLLPRTKRHSSIMELPAKQPDLPVVEIAVLAELKRAGGSQVVRTVIRLLEDAAPEMREELQRAARKSDQLAMLAHRQRGTASSVGARRSAAAMTQLEALATRGTQAEIDACIQRCDRELSDALAVLGRYRHADSAAFNAMPLA